MAEQGALQLDPTEVEFEQPQPKQVKPAAAAASATPLQLSPDEVEMEGANVGAPTPTAVAPPAPAPPAAPAPTPAAKPQVSTDLDRLMQPLQQPAPAQPQPTPQPAAAQPQPQPSQDWRYASPDVVRRAQTEPHHEPALAPAFGDITRAQVNKLTPEMRAAHPVLSGVAETGAATAEGLQHIGQGDIGEFVRSQVAKAPDNPAAWFTNSILDLGVVSGDVAQGLTSPENLALMGAMYLVPETAVGKMASTLVDLGFTEQMATSAAQQVAAGYAAVKKGDFREAGRQWAAAVTTASFAVASARGAAGHAKEVGHELSVRRTEGAEPQESPDIARGSVAPATGLAGTQAAQPAAGEMSSGEGHPPAAAPAPVQLNPDEVEVEGGPSAIRQGAPQVQGGDAPVIERGQGNEPQAGGSDHAVGETGGGERQGGLPAGEAQAGRSDAGLKKTRIQTARDIDRVAKGYIAATELTPGYDPHQNKRGKARVQVVDVDGRRFGYNPAKTNEQTIRDYAQKGDLHKLTGEAPPAEKAQAVRAEIRGDDDSVRVPLESNEPQGATVPSPREGKAEQLSGEVSGRPSGSNEPERAKESEPILARHGETALDKEGAKDTVAGWTAEPLDERGKKSAAEMAEQLKDQPVSKIVTSDLARAKQTADIVGDKLGVPVESDSRLRPQHTPETEGKQMSEAKPVHDYYADHPDERPPGGETFNESLAKDRQAIKEATASTPAGEKPVIITHSRNIEAERGEAPKPGEIAEPKGVELSPDEVERDAPAPGKVGEMNVSDLNVAPFKFQYKLNTDAEGVGSLLKGVRRFNPDLAGQVSVWQDPADGKFYVVNGHHRVELAKRTKTDSIVVRHIEAPTAIGARAIGAMQNISEGRGTSIDAAKFMRDTGTTADDFDKEGISLGEATAKDAVALSKLDTPIFNKVVAGDLRLNRAITIGEATADHAEQNAILKLIDKRERGGGKVSDGMLAELIRLAKGSEKTTETTADLFGNQQVARSLAWEKAEVSDYIKQQIAKDKKLFGFVAKDSRAAELARGGNKIDVEKSREISTGAAQAEEVYNKLSSRGGPMQSILDQAAKRLADGDNAANVKSEAYQRIRAEVSKTLAGREEGDAQRPEGAPKPAETPEGQASKSQDSIDLFGSHAPTFYSKAEKVATEKVPNSASGDAVLATLKNNGVKVDEMKWLGLDDLADKPKVSKAELLERIRENSLQIKDVTKGDQRPSQWQIENGTFGQDADQYFVKMPNGKTYHVGKGTVDGEASARLYLQHYLDGIAKDESRKTATKFQQYTLPGEKKNYSELLMTLPGKPRKVMDTIARDKGYGGWTHALTEEQKQEVIRAYDAQSAEFQSGHFDEPNILAHVRFDERTDADGKRVLLVEEVQSDWHQKGKKHGYKTDEASRVAQEFDRYRDALKDKYGHPFWDKITEAERTKYNDLSAVAAAASPQAVPDAPFKSDWHELAMKRMLREAAEQGYDKLAWVTGAQTAERYDLAKQVDKIYWQPNEGILQAYVPNYGWKYLGGDVTEGKLADYIGKDAAAKIARPEAKDQDASATSELTVHSLAGNDLKIGGEWAKNLYDRAIPNFLSKYGKKWGVKVEETRIRLGEDEKAYRDAERTGDSAKIAEALGGQASVHAIDVTPEMKKSVLDEGQPLFKNDDYPFISGRSPEAQAKIAEGMRFSIKPANGRIPAYLEMDTNTAQMLSAAMRHSLRGVTVSDPLAVAEELRDMAEDATTQGQYNKLRELADQIVKLHEMQPGVVPILPEGREPRDLMTKWEELYHAAVQFRPGKGDVLKGVPDITDDPGIQAQRWRIGREVGRTDPHGVVLVAEGMVDLVSGTAPEVTPQQAEKTATAYYEALAEEHGLEPLKTAQELHNFIDREAVEKGIIQPGEQLNGSTSAPARRALANVLARRSGKESSPGGAEIQSKPKQGNLERSASPSVPDEPLRSREIGRSPATPEKPDSLHSTALVGLDDEELESWAKNKGFRVEAAGEQAGLFGNSDKIFRVFRKTGKGEQSGLVYENQLDRLGISAEGPAQSSLFAPATKTSPSPSDVVDEAKRDSKEAGFATPDLLTLPVTLPIHAAKWASGLYDRLVDAGLEKVQMGRPRPEIRQYDPSLADAVLRMDGGLKYHRAEVENIGRKIVGDLSRDQERGFVMLADKTTRDWLDENKPDELDRYQNDPKIQKALAAYKPFEEALRDAVKELGGKTIDEDYLHRAYDAYTAGIEKKEGKSHAGGSWDEYITPQSDRMKGRKASAAYYYENGLHEFGPSFGPRWMAVMSKLDEHQAAVEFYSKATRLDKEDPEPPYIYYHGKQFFSPDTARQIREARPGSAEARALAQELGISELPKPKEADTYAVTSPFKGSRFENAAFGALQATIDESPEAKGMAHGVIKASGARYAGPNEIVDVFEHAHRDAAATTTQSLMSKMFSPVTQFIRQQIVGLSLGVPHYLNILRKVANNVDYGRTTANPAAWPAMWKVLFDKELKERAIAGVDDPTFDLLLRHSGISVEGAEEFKHYVDGNLNNPKTWLNAFKEEGRQGGRLTLGSTAAGPFRLAREAAGRYAEVGHKNLFKPGGIDQRARLWLADYLKDHDSSLSDAEVSHAVNDALGRYNRTSWTQLQRTLGPLMLFPGWEMSSMSYVLRHPIRSSVPPAIVVWLANRALHSLGQNRNQDKNDPFYIHAGKWSFISNLLREPQAAHLMGAPFRTTRALLDHKSIGESVGEGIKGVPSDVGGATVGTLNPLISAPLDVGYNKLRAGSSKEIVERGDEKRRGKVLHYRGGKAQEDIAGEVARRMSPLYDRAAGDNGGLLPEAGGLVGVTAFKRGRHKR